MSTRTPSQRHLRAVPPAPQCTHTVDNGQGIVFRCDKAPHPQAPDAHYLIAVQS